MIHPKGGVVNQQYVVEEEVIVCATRARGFIGGGNEKNITCVGARTVVYERNAQTTPSVGATSRRGSGKMHICCSDMHICGVFCAICDDFIVGIAVYDGFHIGLIRGTLATEANPYRHGVWYHGDRRVIGAL